MGGLIARTLANVRQGRMQRLLAASTALSAPPLAFEIYLEHYKGSFSDRWEWTPIALTPPLLAPGSLVLVGGMAVMAALMRRER